MIGDVVASRRFPEGERHAVQLGLERLAAALNQRYRRAVAARFLVTLGDEFQGVLKQAAVLPDLIWDIEASLAPADVRIGIGFGTLHPPFKPVALGMDGPAFHAAREATSLPSNASSRAGCSADSATRKTWCSTASHGCYAMAARA